jgi:hypothetical protein
MSSISLLFHIIFFLFLLHLGAGHCWMHVSRECSCGYCPLEAKADIDAKDANIGYTCLHWACRYGHTETVGSHRGGADRCKGYLGWTALHLACDDGYTETAMALIDRGGRH